MRTRTVFTLALLLGTTLLPLRGGENAAPVPSATAGPQGNFLDPTTSSLQKRLPDPPQPGSLEELADLETVLQVQAWRTPEQAAWANYGDKAGLSAFASELGPWFNAKDLPQTTAFMKKVMEDLYPLIHQAKARHPRLRPPYRSEQVKPCIVAPAREESSYPSGHSTSAFTRAAVLGEIFPDQKEALLALAHKLAWSRIQAGVHFPTDDIGGRIFAEAIVAEMKKSKAFQEELERCRAEVAPFRMKQAG